MADPENFGGGDNKNFKHKTSQSSEIQRFFPPKIRWSPERKKKRKKGLTKIETDFSAEIGNSNVFSFSAQNQVVSKKKKKKDASPIPPPLNPPLVIAPPPLATLLYQAAIHLKIKYPLLQVVFYYLQNRTLDRQNFTVLVAIVNFALPVVNCNCNIITFH